MATEQPPTAATLVIGDEILSGRTQDTNTNYVAKFLGALGIDLKEARVVPDIEAEIVAAVNALRARYAIQVPIVPWTAPPRRLLRISAQIYNSPAQYEHLATALQALL